MARSSFSWSSFLGGEWSQFASGRHDLPAYSTAMKVCLNAVPVEEGAWTRRSGTVFVVPTHGRTFCKLLPFIGSETCSFAMAFTNANVQFLTQSTLICDATMATITDSDNTTGLLTIDTSEPSWAEGDEMFIVFPDESSGLYPYDKTLEVGLRNRPLNIASKPSDTTLTIATDTNAGIDPTTWPTGALVGAQLIRVRNIATPYTTPAQLRDLRAIQAETDSIILSGTVTPHVVEITTQGTTSSDPVFTFSALTLKDGPYLDPQTQTLSLSGVSGAVTATAGSAVFSVNDIGRQIRIFTQPDDWDSGTSYSVGDNVTDPSGLWWTAIVANTGVVPGQMETISGVQTVVWVPAPNAGTWAWGKITAFTSSTVVTVTFDTTLPGFGLLTANGTTANVWRLGAFSEDLGYPICGVYHEGRLWLAGSIPNRFDGSISNGIANGIAIFSPTDPFDTVEDDSGISEVLNSKELNKILWMQSDDQGIICGTLGPEWLIAASNLSDPITPTSIQAKARTKYGSSFVEPVRTGMAILFVQKQRRRLMEYLTDAFSGKFSAKHLNKNAKHLSKSGIVELAYQEETVPVAWSLKNDGTLAGCTYRRLSHFVTEDPVMEGFHRHKHGDPARSFSSICTVPGKDGLLERLYTVTNESAANYFIELLQPFPEEEDELVNGWFVDQAPGGGPGNSGYDCGGGNSSTFKPTGGGRGGDSLSGDLDFLDSLRGAPDSAAPLPAAGSTIPAIGAVLMDGVRFDGLTMLSGFPVKPDTNSLSLSFWIGSADDGGPVLNAPEPQLSEIWEKDMEVNSNSLRPGATGRPSMVTVGLGAVQVASPYYLGPGFGRRADGSFAREYEDMAPDGGPYLETLYTGGGTYQFPTDADNDAFYITTDFAAGGTDVVTAATNWSHIMMSIKYDHASNQVTFIIAVNDTVIHDGTSPAFSGTNAMNSLVQTLWPITSLRDALKASGLAAWNIGGVGVTQGWDFLAGDPVASRPTPIEDFPSNIPFSNGAIQQTGLIGNIADIWIAAGVYLDWTDSSVRAKFHATTLLGDLWAPVQLGARGQIPTGSAPWVYCSGIAADGSFRVNRANGKLLNMAGELKDSTLPAR